MLYSILRLLALWILKVFFRMEIKGKENIPLRGSFILASNHVSYLDPIVLGAACTRRVNFMARDNLFYNPLFSWLLRNVAAFPVKRNSADIWAIKEAVSRLRQAQGLVIFPEGSRQIGELSKDIQPGVGFLVVKSNSAIIPAFIKGTDLAWPKGAKFIRPKKITVTFGQKILMERSESHNYQDIANRIMCNIGHLACR